MIKTMSRKSSRTATHLLWWCLWLCHCTTHQKYGSCLAFSPPSLTQTQLRHRHANKHMLSNAPHWRSTTTLKTTASSATALFTTSATTTTATTSTETTTDDAPLLNAFQRVLTRIGLATFVASMCLALPLTLLPQQLLYKLGFLTRVQKEHLALRTAERCAAFLFKIIPFCRLDVYASHTTSPVPTIWVCNHASMLDVFCLLAADRRARGRRKRPIKIVYWASLEDNPVTCLLFRQAGFISVQMAPNEAGEANEYDPRSFKLLLQQCHEAWKDGFDLGILPEGQLNPTPELGLQPVYPGAATLAKMGGKRLKQNLALPIQMLALRGTADLWHVNRGMTCRKRRVSVRCYPWHFYFQQPSDFGKTFDQLVGHFSLTGTDLPMAQQVQLAYQAAPPEWLTAPDTKGKEEANSQQPAPQPEEAKS